MNPDERALLDELKASLKIKLHKACVQAYLDNPTADGLIAEALKDLNRIIDETS